VHLGVLEGFEKMPAEDIQGILNGLNDGREGIRNFAITRVASMGVEVAPALIDLLKRKDGYWHDSASASLIKMGAPAIPLLIEAMNSTDRSTRWGAAAILGALGQEGTLAVDKARKASGVLAAN
jgi:HEAT repeat protein